MAKFIIGLSGRKQSGKSSAAKFLVRNARELFGEKRVGIFPLAGPLKQFCKKVLGLTNEQCYGDDEHKNSLTAITWESLPHYPHIVFEILQREMGDNLNSVSLSEFWNVVRFGPVRAFEETGVARLIPRGPMTSREVQQQVGSEIVRRITIMGWSKACVADIQASDVDIALVDDIRFPNEVEILQQAGALVYRFARQVFQDDVHASETQLDREVYDWSQFDGIIPDLPLAEQNQRLVWLLQQTNIIEKGAAA